MTMITPSYLGETIEYSSLHACRSTLEDPTFVATMGAFLPLRILAELVNIGTLLAFVIVCAAVLIMRRTHPEVHRPFRAPLGPIVPVLGILSCLMLMFSLPAANWLRLVIWLAIGLVIYFAYGQRHSRVARLNRERHPTAVLSRG